MKNGSISENTFLAKAELLNLFFCSVYIESNEETALSQDEDPSIFLIDLHFAVEIIQKYLDVRRSKRPTADEIPPVIFNTMSEFLAPFVYLPFTYIMSTLTWSTAENAPC